MRQAAALPYRFVNGNDRSIEVLLVTSSSKDWVIPKGNIDEGMTPRGAAEREAFEEGGVRGQMSERPIGSYCYCKQNNGAAIPAEVEVFALQVSEELRRWPEMELRRRRWLPLRDAVDAVGKSELATLMRHFRP